MNRLSYFRRVVIIVFTLTIPGLVVAISPEQGDDSRPILQQAFTLRMTGNLDSALFLLQQQIENEPDAAPLYFERARGLFYAMAFDSAASCISRAIQLDPHNSRYHHFAGLIASYRGISLIHRVKTWWKVPGEFHRAVDCFQQAVDLNAECLESRLRLVDMYAGIPWFLGGSRRRAREQAKILADLDPVYGLRGRLKAERKVSGEEKIHLWEATVQEYPENAKAHAWLAREYLRAHHYDLAEEQIDHALHIDSTCNTMLLNAGIICFHDGQLTRAETAFDRYINISGSTTVPQQSFALLQLSRIERKRENSEEAKALSDKARSIDPYCWFTSALPPEELFTSP